MWSLSGSPDLLEATAEVGPIEQVDERAFEPGDGDVETGRIVRLDAEPLLVRPHEVARKRGRAEPLRSPGGAQRAELRRRRSRGDGRRGRSRRLQGNRQGHAPAVSRLVAAHGGLRRLRPRLLPTGACRHHSRPWPARVSTPTMNSRHPPSDTRRAADQAQLEALRRMGPGGRLRAGLRFSGSMVALSRAALRARYPGLDERAVRLLWIEQNYGAELARAVQRRQEAAGWTSTTISSSP